MAINRDLSDLPRSVTNPGAGKHSLPEMVKLFDAWRENYEASADMELPHAIPEAGPYRASFAGVRCDRQLHYRLNKVPRSEPFDINTLWNFYLGHVIGEAMHAAAAGAWPTAIAEAAGDLRWLGIPGSSSADTFVPNNGEGASFNFEYKSTGGYSFKMDALRANGGPKFGAIVQGALSNRALGADRMFVVMIAKENVGVGVAKQHGITGIDRFSATWEFSAAECDVLVRGEAARVGRVLQFADTDILPSRELDDPRYPKGAVITKPERGMWVTTNSAGEVSGTGTAWECDYCDYRARCITDGAGGSESTGGF
jgi:hypothetical protein